MLSSVQCRSFLTILVCSVFLTVFCVNSSNADDPSHAPANEFTPHKALYEIELETVRSGSQIANISGQMYYEWAPDCDAWASEHRFNLFYEYADTPSMRITSDFSTFESFDGKTLNFVSQRKQDGQVFEEVRGNATRNKSGNGEASFTVPKELVYELPEGTLYPMAHSLKVLKAIKTGKKFDTSVMFDGSNDEGPVEVNTFIGKDVESEEVLSEYQKVASIDKTLLGSPAKKIRLAFFPINDPSSTPDYEMNLVLHENSVISTMNIEYDEFSISQKLIALEPVDNACEAQE